MSSPWKSKHCHQRLDYYFFSFLAVKNDFKSQYLRWWYFWHTLSSFKLLLYSPLLCKYERAEKNSDVSLALASRAPLGPVWGGCRLIADERGRSLRNRLSECSFLGSSLNVWLLLSPEIALNTDLPSFLSHKLLDSLDFVQLFLLSGWKRIL